MAHILELSSMPSSIANITSVNPGRLIRRLCKHWGHKFDVTYDEHHGEVPLPIGQCSMKASETVLTVTLVSEDAESLQKLEEVVAAHLVRMAHEESLEISWQPV
jgi:hypothetical protein